MHPGTSQRRSSNLGSAAERQNVSQSQPPPQSTRQMIPNAPSFYDQEEPPPNPGALDYQQWVQANPQSQHHTFDFGSNTDTYAYRQQTRPDQQPQSTQRQMASHRYSFVPEQYQQAIAQPQFLTNRHGQTPDYQQPTQQTIQNSEPYFYPRTSQAPVPHAPPHSEAGYRYPPHSYPGQSQFPLVNAPSESRLAPTASGSTTSEYMPYPAAKLPSVSPISDVPPKSLASAPTPPPPAPSSKRSSAISAPVVKPTERPAAKNAVKKGRKRQRASEETSSETDDSQSPRGSGYVYRPGNRLPGACTHCKKLKMKCDFPKNQNVCKRCKAGSHQCTVEGRKPRSAPNKREYLLAQIRQKDAIIESLLKQLHNPYLATPLSIASYRMATSPSDQNNQNVIDWLDRLTSSYQSSVKAAGGTVGSTAFKIQSRTKNSDMQDSDLESDADGKAATARASRYRATVIDDEGASAGLTGRESGSSGGSDEVDKTSALPDAAVPLGLLAKLSLSNEAKTKHRSRYGDEDVGVANESYFKPGPATDLGIRASMIENHTPPEILVHGLVTPADVDKLFAIFYEKINPHVTLLDPALHTPSTTFTRCPFLFTVVCAVASRYFAEKSEIYPIAMHFAKHAAANALIDGWKSVELCQAYILLYTYGVPAKRWEEDRSWLYIGLAIRIATDLNLYTVQPPSKKPMSERQEREALNRTRVWLICFNLDRSTATQFGKQATIKDDYITRNSADWYKRSRYNHPFDVGLCGYTNLLRIVAKFHDELFSDVNSPTGLNKSLDFATITRTHDEHLVRFQEEWFQRLEDANNGDSAVIFRATLLPYLVNYSRLVMYSFGFQRAFESGIQPNDRFFFTKCFEAATKVVQIMLETLAPSGYMRYSPDGYFVFASFASAFLLKLLRAEFASLLTPDDETQIFDLIGRLIQTLGSPDIAIDDKHTPKLHAKFLAGLLKKTQHDLTISGRINLPQNPPSSQTISHGPYGPMHPSGSSSQVFSLAPPQNTSTSSSSSSYTQEGGSHSTRESAQQQALSPSNSSVSSAISNTSTTIEGTSYQETSYPSSDGGPSSGAVPGEDILMASGVSDETLATLQALTNPSWWNTMMMPGFTWPTNETPTSNGYGYNGYDYNQHHREMVSNSFNGFEIYQTAQVPLG